MSELLLVIPFSANDAVLAEALVDFIFLQNKRTKAHHCLLVAAGDVHGEATEKVKLAAEVAFESHELIRGPVVEGPNKNVRVNAIFRTAAMHIEKNYRMPWFWLEPDCAPLEKRWFRKIEDSYFNQPKRYCGSFLMGKELFMARVACYPPNAFSDLDSFLTGHIPFNVAAGTVIIPKATKTRLVQEVAFYDESTKMNGEAVLLHKDPNAILISKQREVLDAAQKTK